MKRVIDYGLPLLVLALGLWLLSSILWSARGAMASERPCWRIHVRVPGGQLLANLPTRGACEQVRERMIVFICSKLNAGTTEREQCEADAPMAVECTPVPCGVIEFDVGADDDEAA